MRTIKPMLFFAAVTALLISCKKSSSAKDCMDTHTTKVVYTNTGTIPLRVEVAIQFTPQYQPIDPVVSVDLAPGVTVVKEFSAHNYFTKWSRDCSSSCNTVTFYAKTYNECSDYEEKQGI